MNRRLGLLAAVSVVVVAVFGLNPSQATPAPTPSGSITVSAAASLTDVFPVIANAFMKKYPGTSVKFNKPPSPQLSFWVSIIQSLTATRVDTMGHIEHYLLYISTSVCVLHN